MTAPPVRDLTTALHFLEGYDLPPQTVARCVSRLRSLAADPTIEGKAAIVASTAANNVELAILARSIGMPSGQPSGCSRLAERLRYAIRALESSSSPRM